MSEWCLGLDTETTGLYLHHGCRPFFVSAVGDKSEDDRHSWEWHVDPITRIPTVPKKDVRQITDLINSVDKLVFFNCKFDLHALRLIGVKLPPWKKIYDISTEYHVLTSDNRAALKPLAARFLQISNADQQELHRIVVRARNIAKKLGWSIATKEHPHFISASKSSKGMPLSDMWIPKQLALLPNWHKYITEAERSHWLTTCAKYAMLDAERTILLHYVFYPEILDQGFEPVFRRQQAAFCPLFSLEKTGFPVIPDRLKEQETKLSQKVKTHFSRAIQIVKDHTPFKNYNPNSSKQTIDLLYHEWKLPIKKYTPPSKKTKQSNPSTDFETRLRLAFEPGSLDSVPKAKRKIVREFLLETLTAGKLQTSARFLTSYAKNQLNNRIHCTMWNQGTSTTRMSCTEPNLNNPSKGGAESGIEDPDIRLFLEELSANNETNRCVFGPSPGTFWYDIDYSQLQLRIFAYVAGETGLIKAFDDGWDAHTYVARKIFRLRDDEEPTKLQRRIAKAVNFGFIFGAAPEKIEATAGRPGLWDEVIQIFPSAHKFMEATMEQVKRRGYVMTPGGYRLYCNKKHKGVNFIVQGAEGEIAKKAMVDCQRYLRTLQKEHDINAKFLLPVHDELVFEFPTAGNKPILKTSDSGKSTVFLKDLSHVRTLCKLMESAGDYFGIKTPVDPQVVLKSWDKGYDISNYARVGV